MARLAWGLSFAALTIALVLLLQLGTTLAPFNVSWNVIRSALPQPWASGSVAQAQLRGDAASSGNYLLGVGKADVTG